MSCLLHIDTATDICSVALTNDGEVVCERVSDGSQPQHAALLAPYVEEMLSMADSHAMPLDGVAVSMGPGSYTGLRIGVSTAKGVCYARQVPLIAVPTLEMLCVPVLLEHDELPDEALLCPMIDARRMEVYTCLYDRALREVRPTQALVVDADTLADVADQRPVYIFGGGAGKCASVIAHPNVHFLDGIRPLARYMMPLAERRIAQGRFEDTAYFEPYYLKDFVAIKSKPLF